MQLSVGPILKYPGPNTGIARTQYFIYRPRPWPRNKVLGLDFVEAKAKAKILTTNNFRSYDIEENEVVQLGLFTDDIILQVWLATELHGLLSQSDANIQHGLSSGSQLWSDVVGRPSGFCYEQAITEG